METYFPKKGSVDKASFFAPIYLYLYDILENASYLLMSTPIAEFNFKQRA
jgi:hypothetical protein